MAGKQYATELTEGMSVDTTFVLRSREMRATRAGEAYLTLELSDRTGRMPAVLFRPDSESSAVPSGAVVRVRGRVTSFRGISRISLESMRPARSWARDDMLPASTRPRAELVAQLRRQVRSIEHPELRRLVTSVFGDRTYFARFCECPGSQSVHHAYLGGLLEHTVTVAEQARAVGGDYPGVDCDLLCAAALLHDIGKVDELTWDTTIEYTDQGRLIGHVVLGVQRLQGAMVKSGLDSGARARLEHAILSHHGELEWGAPKRPSTVEALALHHLDNLDAKLSGFLATLCGAELVDESWTDAFNLFQRPLYAPRAVEDDRPGGVEEDLGHQRRSA